MYEVFADTFYSVINVEGIWRYSCAGQTDSLMDLVAFCRRSRDRNVKDGIRKDYSIVRVVDGRTVYVVKGV